jgi:hypothetical protein
MSIIYIRYIIDIREISDIMAIIHIKGTSGYNGYNNMNPGNGDPTVYLKRFSACITASTFNSVECFSIMFKQNIGVANTRVETDEYMIENCHNGVIKGMNVIKGIKYLSID